MEHFNRHFEHRIEDHWWWIFGDLLVLSCLFHVFSIILMVCWVCCYDSLIFTVCWCLLICYKVTPPGAGWGDVLHGVTRFFWWITWVIPAIWVADIADAHCQWLAQTCANRFQITICTAPGQITQSKNQKVFVYFLTVHGILCRANMSKLFAPGDALRRSFLKRCAEIQAVKNHLPAASYGILGGSVC